MNIEQILSQIQDSIKNPTTMHPLDDKRIAKLLYEEAKTNGWYGMDEIQTVINSLDPKYSAYTKNRIQSIAGTIQLLFDESW